jgi:large subunit ribosomal protein L10
LRSAGARTFRLARRGEALAVSKERKEQLVADYAEQLRQSRGIILTDYRGLTMASLTEIRQTLRPIGARSQVVKNRLLALALEKAGMSVPEEWLVGPTAVGFCFEEVPAVAKALRDAAREYETFQIKGAIVGTSVLSADEVSAIADLPARDVLLAQVLGAINAPAGQVAGLVANSVRQILNVVQAYIDKLEEAGSVAAGGQEPVAEPA